MLDATDEHLVAGILQRAQLHDECALGRQRHVGRRAGTSQRMVIVPHDAGTSVRRPAGSVRNAETLRKGQMSSMIALNWTVSLQSPPFAETTKSTVDPTVTCA